MTFVSKWLQDEIEITSSLHPREFLDSLDVGISIQNADGVLVSCNQYGQELLGHTKDQIVGRTLDDLPWEVEGEDGSPVPPELLPGMKARKSGASQPAMTIAIKNPEIPVRWLSLSAYPILVDGKQIGTLSSFVDLTDQREQLQSLELMKVVNRLLLQALDEQEFLQDTCNAFVESGYALAKIDVAEDNEEMSVRTLCAAGAVGYLYPGMTSWSEASPHGRCPSGTAVRTRSTQVVNSLATEAAFAPWRERAISFNLGSVISIPLDLGGSRAVFSVYEMHAYEFSESKVQMLEVMISDIEFGIGHLEAVVKTRNALAGTISALSRMTASRDPYTAGHLVRVGSLAEAIARQLGLDPEMATLIRQSGELHDIGKIAIPAEILSRPGRLSELEFDMVKRHTVVGGDILSNASLPWPIAEVAVQHHERLVGSGYPQGLRGNAIALPARIIAVADVVEAMTQHRPYRAGLGIDAALAEVTNGAGSRYDADVVAACLKVFEDGYVLDSDPSSTWG